MADERPLSLTPEQFQQFYAQTARPLKSYLMRLVRNSAIADEVLQESYYKFLKVDVSGHGERDRKNYLFRIATNLVNDMYRGRKEASLPIEHAVLSAAKDPSHSGVKADVQKVLGELKPREREMVWLAYVEGSSHREIADILGIREVSIRPMLFKIRQRLATLLKSVGYCERMVN